MLRLVVSLVDGSGEKTERGIEFGVELGEYLE